MYGTKQNQQEYNHLFKLLLIGNSGVGKSCMLMKYSENQFTNNFYNTIGVDFKVKSLQINGKNIKLQIWDTAGQDRFRTITNSYYRGAHGILIVFDVTDQESFENVQTWCQEIQKYAQQNVNRVLVGNKCDCRPEERKVSEQQGKQLAAEYKIPYIETSAKEGINIDEAFNSIAAQILQRVGNSKPQQQQQNTVKLGQQNRNQNGQPQRQGQQQQDNDLCC